MIELRCATCVFFAPHRPSWADRPTGRGQCRRHAPVLDKEPDGRIRSLWPMVGEDAYCGEHAQIAAEPVAEQLQPKAHPPHVPPCGPEWRCINCKHIEVSEAEPERCFVCRCQGFAKVASS